MIAPLTPLDDARAYLSRFVSFPSPEAADAAALFCAYTHASDRFDVAPRFLIQAAEHECGKSTLGRAMRYISARPLVASRATGAALYRSLGVYRDDDPRGYCPTLILDEMDTLAAATLADISGTVNAGFESGAPIPRCESKGDDVIFWNTFGPAIIVGIEIKLAESTLSRCIQVTMRRVPGGPGRLRGKRIPELAEPVVARLRRLTQDCDDLAWFDADRRDLGDRELDLWEPLLIVAEAVDERWPGAGWRERAYAAAVALRPPASTVDLLADIAAVLPDCWAEFVDSAWLLAALRQDVGHSDWTDYAGGRGLSGKALALKLRAYGVEATQQTTGKRARGYSRAALVEAVETFRPHGDLGTHEHIDFQCVRDVFVDQHPSDLGECAAEDQNGTHEHIVEEQQISCAAHPESQTTQTDHVPTVEGEPLTSSGFDRAQFIETIQAMRTEGLNAREAVRQASAVSAQPVQPESK